MMDEHHCAVGLLRDPVPSLDDQIDCAVIILVDPMRRNEWVHYYRVNLIRSDRVNQLSYGGAIEAHEALILDRRRGLERYGGRIQSLLRAIRAKAQAAVLGS